MSAEDALLCDPSEKAAREAANGVAQIEYIDELVSERGVIEIRESHVLELHQLAIEGIYPCGGQYRSWTRNARIQGSAHQLPEPALVQSLVQDALEWVNTSRGRRSALERAAYVLWRFNWIHPFAGGNGRTSRALSYLIVCIDNGAMLPGTPTMPHFIYERRDDYIEALRAADRSVLSDSNAEPDLRAMTDLLRDVLTRQLARAIDRLTNP